MKILGWGGGISGQRNREYRGPEVGVGMHWINLTSWKRGLYGWKDGAGVQEVAGGGSWGLAG